MKFESYITEFSRARYGKGITFVDVDETMFKTFAKVLVKKDGVVVRELDNMQYNTYKPEEGEEYDFGQFRDAEFFRKTSIPIPKMVARVKKMISQIKSQDTGSKIVFLTARGEFRDMGNFYQMFKEHGIGIDRSSVSVCFMREGASSVDREKKKSMMEYVETGEYRRVRLIDDHKPNLKALREIERELPKEIEQKVIDKYELDMTTEKLPPISFYALWIDANGNLKKV